MKVIVFSFFLCLFTAPFLIAQNDGSLIDQAEAQYKRGNILGSIQLLDSLLSQEPANYLALQKRGRSYRKFGNLASALKDYNQALKSNPGFVPAFLGRAQAYLALSNYTAAQQDYEQALNLAPEHPKKLSIHYNLAGIYFELKQLDKASALYEDILSQDPQHTQARVNRGVIRYLKNQAQEACDDWSRARESGSRVAQRNHKKACPE